MNLNLVKVLPPLAARIEAEPDLLSRLWSEDDETPADPDPQIAAVDLDRDIFFDDYDTITREYEEAPEYYQWMNFALEGPGDVIAYDLGWGDGFIVSPRDVAKIADGLELEGWWSPGEQVTLLTQAIAAFYRSA